MAREVDIWWESGDKLKASMRWTNKRGEEENKKYKYDPGCLCSMLWEMLGDNQFERRDRIIGWQPLGPVGREKKKK